jgi:MoxR-like ATPase
MTEYVYKRKFFDPKVEVVVEREEAVRGGDRPEGSPYVYDPRIILAVNVALAANRPLLVAGPPGSGKSSLAWNISKQQGWGYTSKVITARTEARDLLWRFDAIARLQAARTSDDSTHIDARGYLTKGVLWEAFDASRKGERMVVLLDEIDKADPDLPSSLLETLGIGTFFVEDIQQEIRVDRKTPPFIVITTNNERELSRPFVRRCVTLTLPAPNAAQLLGIAERWKLAGGNDRPVAEELASEVVAAAAGKDANSVPSAAEYLDALRTCLQLEIRPGSDEWQAVRGATLTKRLAVEGEPGG